MHEGIEKPAGENVGERAPLSVVAMSVPARIKHCG